MDETVKQNPEFEKKSQNLKKNYEHKNDKY